jgi:hypothetical protein
MANEKHYTVMSFTDDAITVDTTGVGAVTADDILAVNYIYWDETQTPSARQVDCYASDAMAFIADAQVEGDAAKVTEKYLTSIVQANATLAMDPDYAFDQDKDANLRKDNLYILLAQCFYNLHLFENSLIAVQELDPGFDVDFDTDPAALYKLQNKIEMLLSGV